jgi:tight adherence protein B
MRTVLLALCGAGIGTGLWLAYTARHPLPPQPVDNRPGRIHLSPRRAIIAVVCAALAYAATGWIAALPIAAAAAYFLPVMLGPDRDHARRLAVIEAVATFTEMLRDTLSAAAGLNQALAAACRNAPDALQPAAGQLAEDLDVRTTTTREALRAFADRVDDATCDLVALALAAASEHPTRDLAALLSTLAETAREQAAMRTRIAVAQARTQTAIRMITGTTIGLGILLTLIDHTYLTAYDSATGQVVLLWVALIFAAAFRWLRALARTPEDSRLFTVTEASSAANRSIGGRG